MKQSTTLRRRLNRAEPWQHQLAGHQPCQADVAVHGEMQRARRIGDSKAAQQALLSLKV